MEELVKEGKRNMEELVFENYDAEAVNKSPKGYKTKYYFPACYVGDAKITFNAEAARVFLSDAEAVKWYISTDYVFAFPTDRRDRNGYVLTPCGGVEGRGSIAVSTPHKLLNEKSIPFGHRKILKCKNGLAFSRYETI